MQLNLQMSYQRFQYPIQYNAALASTFIYAICKLQPEDIAILSWDEY